MLEAGFPARVLRMDTKGLYTEIQGRGIRLSHRSLVLAIRYGLADWQKGVNVEKMIAVIESGDVWKMRGVGKKTVQEWYGFISQSIGKDSRQSHL